MERPRNSGVNHIKGRPIVLFDDTDLCEDMLITKKRRELEAI